MEQEFDFVQYANDVRDFLRTYSNIEEIKVPDLRSISLRQELFEFGDDDDDEDEDEENIFASGEGIFPWPVNWSIEFIIHIPDRIQNEILSQFWRPVNTIEATKFRVSICYEHEFPVAFVSGVDGNLSEPNEAIVLIRKYLEKYAPKNSTVEFQFLGPSPFHADFYVEESENFDFRIEKSPGYDDVYFGILPDIDKNEIESFISQLEIEISQELGLYYRTIQTGNRLRDQWERFAGSAEDILISLTNRKSWRRKAIELGAPPKFDKLSIDLVDYEIAVEHESRQIKDRINEVSNSYGLDRFSEYINSEINKLSNAPTEKFDRIIRTIQDHNKAVFGYRVALIGAFIGIVAALLGGAAGSFATLMLSK